MNAQTTGFARITIVLIHVSVLAELMPDVKLETTELSAVVQPDTEAIPFSNVLLTQFVPRGKLRTRKSSLPKRTRRKTRRWNFQPRRNNSKIFLKKI